MHNEVWGCAEIFPSSVHEVISKQYLLHAIFKVGQSWSSIWRNFAVFYVKNLLFIKTFRNPVILRSSREVNDEESVLDKFFVLCELFMHNFSVKRDVISMFFLLLVLDEGQSLRCSDQHNTFTLAKFFLEILVPHQNVLDISHF